MKQNRRSPLSDMNKERIVKLWNKGMSNREISEVLDIDFSSVESITFVLKSIRDNRTDKIRGRLSGARAKRTKWVCNHVGYDWTQLVPDTPVEHAIAEAEKADAGSINKVEASTNELGSINELLLEQHDKTIQALTSLYTMLKMECDAINQALTQTLTFWGADVSSRKDVEQNAS